MTSSVISLMTFNIRTSKGVDGLNSWWFRRRSTLQAICSSNADLIALQEVRFAPLSYLRKRLGGYHVISAGRDDGQKAGEHCTVFVRKDRFEVQGWEVRWFSPAPERPGSIDPDAAHPRIATVVQLIDLSNKTEFGLVNVHLDHQSSSARQRSISDLVLHLNGVDPLRPWIITGDFNCTIDDPALEPIWMKGYRDALSPLSVMGPGSASCHAFTGATDGVRIDHVLLPEGISPLEAYIDFDRPRGKLPSDHWPVRVKLAISPKRIDEP